VIYFFAHHLCSPRVNDGGMKTLLTFTDCWMVVACQMPLVICNKQNQRFKGTDHGDQCNKRYPQYVTNITDSTVKNTGKHCKQAKQINTI